MNRDPFGRKDDRSRPLAPGSDPRKLSRATSEPEVIKLKVPEKENLPPPAAKTTAQEPVALPVSTQTRVRLNRSEDAMRSMAEAAPPPSQGELFDHSIPPAQRSAPIKFMVFCGIGLVALFAGLLALNRSVTAKPAPRTEPEPVRIEPSVTSLSPASDLDLGENSGPQVTQVALAFVNAKTPAEVIAISRNSSRVAKIIEANWKPYNLAQKWEIPKDTKWMTHLVGKREFGVLKGQITEMMFFSFYFVNEAGRIVLDWEATSGHSEIPFEDLSNGKGGEGMVRAFISPAEFYTLSMPESDFQCYRLTSADAEIAIWGYVPRGTEIADELEKLFTSGTLPRQIQREYRIMLRVKKNNPEALPNQWSIEKMEQLDWVVP